MAGGKRLHSFCPKFLFLFLGVIPLCCSSPQTLHQEFWDPHHLHSTWEGLLLGQEVMLVDTRLDALFWKSPLMNYWTWITCVPEAFYYIKIFRIAFSTCYAWGFSCFFFEKQTKPSISTRLEFLIFLVLISDQCSRTAEQCSLRGGTEILSLIFPTINTLFPRFHLSPLS